MQPPERLVVDELVVRTYEVADALALVRAVTESAEHLRPWMSWIAHEPQTVEQRVGWINDARQRRRAGGGTVYGIFEDDRVVGGTGLHARSTAGVIEIGYWVHVDRVRRAIATRVSAALTTAAFGMATIEAVEIRHDRLNVASGRVPARLGYTLVEEARRLPQAPGESGLMHRWRTTRADWLRHPG